MDVRDTQNLYRRLGRFLQTIKTPPLLNGSEFSSKEEAINIPNTSDDTLAVATSSTIEPHVFVVAKSRHYGHELSFEKFSNCGWDTKLHFNNGGLAVNLLQMDYSKLSKVRHTLSAYQSISSSVKKETNQNNNLRLQ